MKKCLQGNYDFFSFHDDKKTSAIKKNQKLLRETLLEIGTILDSKILDQIPILISLKNTEGYYLICNLAFENFFGKKKDSIINTTDYSLISKEQADCIKDVEKKFWKEIIHVKAKNGLLIWMVSKYCFLLLENLFIQITNRRLVF